jgi:hypothetical protein
MANVLEMAIVQAIQNLYAAKWSQRRIARELGIDRGTVARCLRTLQSDPKPAIPPTGSEGSKAASFEGPPAPAAEDSGGNEDANRSVVPKPAIPPGMMALKTRLRRQPQPLLQASMVPAARVIANPFATSFRPSWTKGSRRNASTKT